MRGMKANIFKPPSRAVMPPVVNIISAARQIDARMRCRVAIYSYFQTRYLA
jgi:hypothetical protein